MSRSYKKHPVCSDRCNSRSGRRTLRWQKRKANKQVRRQQELFNGNHYQKISESYEIRDYVNHWSWAEARKEYEKDPYWKKRYPTLESFHNFWAKYYRRK